MYISVFWSPAISNDGETKLRVSYMTASTLCLFLLYSSCTPMYKRVLFLSLLFSPTTSHSCLFPILLSPALVSTTNSRRYNTCWLLFLFAIVDSSERNRETARERRRSSARVAERVLQVALVSRNRNFVGLRERRVYMESSLHRTRTEIASLAGWRAVVFAYYNI